MRYELNFDEDKVNDVLVVGGASYDLKGCCELLNEQQAIITHLEKVNGKNFAKRRLLEQDNLVLRNENEQLRQIMNDIVVATDETYAKNASVFKVTVVLDFEKYMEIRRCIE